MTDPRRGAALLVVLVFAALISSLAIAAMRASVSGAAAAAVFVDEMRAEELGRDAAYLVAYQLRSGDPEAPRGGSFAARLPSADISVDYLSEMARIDVNLAPPQLLAALFVAGGADPDAAAEFAGRAQRARGAPRAQPPSGTANPNPPSTTSESTAAAPAFVRTEQIIEAWGLPESLYRSIRPALTVASRSAKVDPVLAGRLVVAALMDGDDERAGDFLARRSRGFLSADEALAQLPATIRPYAGFAATRAVRAIVRVDVAHRLKRNYEFVMTVPEGVNAETRILSWQPLDR